MIRLIFALIILLIGCDNSKMKNIEIEKTINSQDSINENLIEKNSILQQQNSVKCDLKTLVTISNNIERLNDTLIDSLLFSINKECENNVEFGEFSNELLFIVLEKEPKLFINEFEKLKNRIDTNLIFFQLENPLHDLIDLKPIKAKVEDVRIENETKRKIIKSIDIALDKY